MQDILTAIGGLVEVVKTQAATVDALAERVAHIADSSGASTVAAFVPFEMTQETSYSDLTPTDDGNELRRYRLAAALGILGQPSGDELLRHGARGFYRSLDRGDMMIHEMIPREICVWLVQDAELEDVTEAQNMATELLPMLSDDIQGGVDIPVLDQ